MKNDTKLNYYERIKKVLIYIHTNLDEELSLEKLASIASFSPFHFHRVFRGMTGKSLAIYVRNLRLEKAALDLKQSSISITDLAFNSGYETVESFTRAFKKQYKICPSNYRKQDIKKIIFNNFKIDFLPSKGGLSMNVKLEKQKLRKVAYVGHKGSYNQCSKAWETLCSWAGPKGLLGPKTEYLGLCYDDPDVTPAEKIRYDACIMVDDNITIDNSASIKIQDIPEGKYAIAIHQGPYDKLKDTYAELCGKWAPNSGMEIMDKPSIEIYLNDPKNTPPEDLKVEIQIPVK